VNNAQYAVKDIIVNWKYNKQAFCAQWPQPAQNLGGQNVWF